uniref:Uncharacterized protein n=1 Tax=Pithovirus LCPAC304 TaxID=2506594 RepID=A0A481ZA98_9VIRU|nr:MAG: hypothetical protein LCPAC304_06290 [Pithovirus LCPAC304]
MSSNETFEHHASTYSLPLNELAYNRQYVNGKQIFRKVPNFENLDVINAVRCIKEKNESRKYLLEYVGWYLKNLGIQPCGVEDEGVSSDLAELTVDEKKVQREIQIQDQIFDYALFRETAEILKTNPSAVSESTCGKKKGYASYIQRGFRKLPCTLASELSEDTILTWMWGCDINKTQYSSKCLPKIDNVAIAQNQKVCVRAIGKYLPEARSQLRDVVDEGRNHVSGPLIFKEWKEMMDLDPQKEYSWEEIWTPDLQTELSNRFSRWSADLGTRGYMGTLTQKSIYGTSKPDKKRQNAFTNYILNIGGEHISLMNSPDADIRKYQLTLIGGEIWKTMRDCRLSNPDTPLCTGIMDYGLDPATVRKHQKDFAKYGWVSQPELPFHLHIPQSSEEMKHFQHLVQMKWMKSPL